MERDKDQKNLQQRNRYWNDESYRERKKAYCRRQYWLKRESILAEKRRRYKAGAPVKVEVR